jgi:bleomycin hydrolase
MLTLDRTCKTFSVCTALLVFGLFLTNSHAAVYGFQEVVEETETEKKKETKSETSKESESSKESEKKERDKKGFGFSIDYQVDCSPVRKQDKTGTCWCFAGTSFLESELMRRGEGTHDLSEMFIVKNVYAEKAQNYVLRQGKANFSQGALAHDYINAVGRYGLVPEEVFSGKTLGEKEHNHTELEVVVKGMLDGYIKQKKVSPRWKTATSSVFDVYLGQTPENFQYQGETFTPQDLAKSLEVDASDYLNFTSYTHHPFYEKFVLEIPDNFSNGSFFNVPIDEMVDMVDEALENGYSIAWDGDVSEAGFSASRGIAVVPEKVDGKIFKEPSAEKEVTQEMRQDVLMTYSTTDDHLMHLVGAASDKNGAKYYLIKNSWGEIGPHRGYLYMSEAYFRLHTVSVLLHKDAVPRQLR